jgi:hypothetical protein
MPPKLSACFIAVLNLPAPHEYNADERVQGASFGINLIKKS